MELLEFLGSSAIQRFDIGFWTFICKKPVVQDSQEWREAQQKAAATSL